MIAFISDIHGNFPALESVITEIKRIGCEKVICLGDMCGYYCMVNECIELLKKEDVHCLLGNHDYYMISGTCCNSKTVKICIDFQKKIIKAEYLSLLRTLLPEYDTDRFSLRHGGWVDPLEERIGKFDFHTATVYEQKIFLSGHTHIQKIEKKGDVIYCNPGSVGQPRDGDPRAAFAVLDHEYNISLHRVSYDIDKIVSEMKKAHMGDWIWKWLYEGKRIGG